MFRFCVYNLGCKSSAPPSMLQKSSGASESVVSQHGPWPKGGVGWVLRPLSPCRQTQGSSSESPVHQASYPIRSGIPPTQTVTQSEALSDADMSQSKTVKAEGPGKLERLWVWLPHLSESFSQSQSERCGTW